MPLTYKAANMYLDNLVGAQQVSRKSSYLGLSTTAPNRDGTGYTEPDASAGYGRVKLGNDASSWQAMKAASLGATTNESTIFFPEATASWGTCTHYLLFDAETGGNLLAYGPLDESIKPVANKVPIVREGNLNMTMR